MNNARVVTDIRVRALRLRGFTLIELLVVVSIIALLISILLPSLKSAREQAKTVACTANLHGYGQSSAIYQAANNGFFAGGPGTSGSELQSADDITTASVVQKWDWFTPLADYKSKPPTRADQFRDMAERALCPKNQFVSRPFPAATTEWRPMQAVSYYTVRLMMLWPEFSSSAPFLGATVAGAGLGGFGDSYFYPSGYSPRIERVGNPSEKIFLSDGGRFIDDEGNLTYNTEWDASAGGAFSSGGAALNDEFLRDFHLSKIDPRKSKVTYRHKRGSDTGIGVGFHDGHSEYMSEAKSRKPDPWYPKGMVVTRSELNEPSFLLVAPRQQLWPVTTSSGSETAVGYKVR